MREIFLVLLTGAVVPAGRWFGWASTTSRAEPTTRGRRTSASPGDAAPDTTADPMRTTSRSSSSTLMWPLMVSFASAGFYRLALGGAAEQNGFAPGEALGNTIYDNK